MKYKQLRLGDLAEFTTGKLNANKAVEDGKYPFFTTSPETLRINNFAFDQDAILLGGNNANGVFQLKRYTGKFNAYQRTYVISVVKENIINNDYLYYALMPKLVELQNKSLGTIDNKIQLNKQLNANLQELRHILYKQLIAQSALKTISIKELYSIKYGKTLPKSQLLRTGTKVFGAKGFMGYTERKPLVNKATVTITSRGSGAGFVSYIDEEEAFLTNNLLYLIDKTGLGLSFTYELIKSSKPSQFVTGSAQPQLTINNLKQLKLKIPTDRFIIEQFKNNTKRIEDCMSNNKIENNSLQKLRLAFLNYYF
ncbi:type I restriction system specificity protein [Limosilactobacillus coleohominis DSM 14060]|nr:type I restriction system specificity protein [Limosilactobacillus coleohominis DSM 14060]